MARWEEKCTNLSLSEDGQKEIRSVISSTPRSNKQQRINGVKRRRLDEHGDDGLVQSSGSRWSPHSSANVPAVQDEARNDHEREEDVERNRNRKVWKTKVDGDRVPDAAVRLRSLVDGHDTHRYVDNVNSECRATGLRRTRVRTHRGEEHEAGEGDDPEVHGVDNVTTIELEEQPALGAWMRELDAKVTKRPSASQLFKRNMRLGTMLRTLE